EMFAWSGCPSRSRPSMMLAASVTSPPPSSSLPATKYTTRPARAAATTTEASMSHRGTPPRRRAAVVPAGGSEGGADVADLSRCSRGGPQAVLAGAAGSVLVEGASPACVEPDGSAVPGCSGAVPSVGDVSWLDGEGCAGLG